MNYLKRFHTHLDCHKKQRKDQYVYAGSTTDSLKTSTEMKFIDTVYMYLVVSSAMVELSNLYNEELLAVICARASIGPCFSASRCFLFSLSFCLSLFHSSTARAWLTGWYYSSADILFISSFHLIDVILDRLLSKRNFQFVRPEFKWVIHNERVKQ